MMIERREDPEFTTVGRVLLAAALALAACTDDVRSLPDAGAGSLDAVASMDAAPRPDASSPADASSPTMDAAATTPVDAGHDPCTSDRPCNLGACTGLSCDTPWQCVPEPGGCTEDLAPYCGCDGQTFRGSSTCPPRPFAYRGACEEVEGGENCDHRDVTCRRAEPTCPTGQVASVRGTCWGPCVAIEACGCREPAQCPKPDRYTCHRLRRRCGPPV